ncbi:hypothetical protein ACFL4T_03965 [candidate division KSB1 bacterium]
MKDNEVKDIKSVHFKTKTEQKESKSRMSKSKLTKNEPTDFISHYNLCSLCMGDATCTFPRKPGKPVLFCEEFKEYPSKEVKVGPKKESIDKTRTDDRVSKGLCCNCENRLNCIFPKPEGGVWHCEEYI